MGHKKYSEHKSTEKYNDICELKHRILDYVKGQIADGLEDDPTKVMILGQYVDMIKDLAETEKACHEACYYESVVEAMDEAKDDEYPMYNDRMGYPRGRNAMGQFTSGRGRSGYPDEWPYDDRMGYDGRSQSGTRMTNTSSSRQGGRSQSGNRMGYMDDWRMTDDDMRHDRDWNENYGRPFNQFRQAKRHYTESHSENDKEEMNEHANEHLMQVMATTKEMYRSSEPDMRKRMKADLTKFVNDLEA